MYGGISGGVRGGVGGGGLELVIAWFCAALSLSCPALLVCVLALQKALSLARIQAHESLKLFYATKRTYVSYVAA
jgi:hypothetical protein